ncbi:acyltransferase family protein [Gemella sanguinis]|jgi:O-acetyltransferase oatA|uniref:Acetyltransferase n=1 Tax=Gemella sanguinis TaxID=84135 RepID=A0A2N6SEB7_9BACL|nr:acyltransferase family protein [Gemella sanguinis]PMC52261.1 acetyltransferase [Gemella sanguinis]
MSKKTKYLPSIDSLRAIAVIAVIIYHIDANYLPGGFLGVDLFFVLSGYLISSLIIKEYKSTGTVNLYNFYVRRARRLLPAVYFMITVVLIIITLFNGVLLKKSYLDALFGYIYSSNWWYIFHKLDYFDSFGSQSPFKHLWSLAIEEQFYMFFPLIFLIFNRKSKSNNGNSKLNKNFIYVVLSLILVSLIAHILLFDINNINRIYFGTDTRAFSLLVGVVGAILYPMDRLSERTTKKDNMIYSIVSLVSILVLIGIMINTSEYNTWLYRGGFLLVAIIGLIIIISSGRQYTFMSKLLSFKPFVFIGKISYSLYLWHFPILVVTTPVSEIGNPNLFYVTLRIVLIFLVATGSYMFVETPIRKLGFVNYINLLFKRIMKFKNNTKKIIFASIALVAVVFTMGVFGKSVPYLSTAFVTEMSNNKESQFISNNNDNNTNNSSEHKSDNNNQEGNKSEDKKYSSLLVIGDSLTVDIGEKIKEKYPGAIIDGKISRQLTAATALADQYANYNNENTAVIFQLGTNGFFTESQVEELVKKFDKADIYFVNVKVPRTWEKTVNKELDALKERHSDITIIDWYSVANNNQNYFEPDKVHLNSEGVETMVSLIEKSLKHPVEIK